MTSQEYRARLKAFGLTPKRPSYEGATIYVGRDGALCMIADPEGLDPDEREAMLEIYILQYGLSEPH